jgi:hypothetical protein
MSAERIQGGWCISEMIGGYRVKRLYIGYTKREAMREFRAEFKRGAA